MLEIVIAAILAVTLLAKRPAKRRASGNFRAIRFQFNVSVGTLAPGVMITTSLGMGSGNEYWAISCDATVVLENVTQNDGGPLAFGFCHGDYSITELDEWYEATNQFTGDQVEIEQGRRKVRDGGIMVAAGGASLSMQTFNDGRVKRFKLGWRCESTQTTNVWIRNMGDAAYSTTVPIFRGYGKLFVKLL